MWLPWEVVEGLVFRLAKIWAGGKNDDVTNIPFRCLSAEESFKRPVTL